MLFSKHMSFSVAKDKGLSTVTNMHELTFSVD